MLRDDVMEHVVRLLSQLATDWEYSGTITPETLLFTDLGFQSLDAVVLGNSLQEHFGKPIPYADLLADIGQRQFNDVTVGEWVQFTYDNLQRTQPVGVAS